MTLRRDPIAIYSCSKAPEPAAKGPDCATGQSFTVVTARLTSSQLRGDGERWPGGNGRQGADDEEDSFWPSAVRTCMLRADMHVARLVYSIYWSYMLSVLCF